MKRAWLTKHKSLCINYAFKFHGAGITISDSFVYLTESHYLI